MSRAVVVGLLDDGVAVCASFYIKSYKSISYMALTTIAKIQVLHGDEPDSIRLYKAIGTHES